LTGQTTQTPLDTPKNAALAGSSAVLNQYAQQILDSIKRDGFYVRVPAGKQFYLYVTQTIDLDNAKRGQSLVDLKPENKTMKIHYLFPALLLVGCASSNPPTVECRRRTVAAKA
jgi:hypothetical protein